MNEINREELLTDLQMVKAGLSPREFIEQSNCFVFRDGHVMTFNDEVACRKKTSLTITGAVQATSLLAILEKLEDPELRVEENERGELEFRGKGRRFAVTKDAEVFLPIDRVEEPERWRPLPPEFVESVDLVRHCASKDETKFSLTCIHLHPEYIEACDNKQLLRCRIVTGLKRSVLVRSSALDSVITLGMDEVASTKSWIHFKNPSGLVFSCRKYVEDYPSLDEILVFKGHPVVLPKGLAEASDKAAIFATDKSTGDPLVMVSLAEGVIRISGEGATGWYKEVRRINYNGPAMKFLIAPSLLRGISEKYSDAQISTDRLKVSGGHWDYITVLGKAGSSEQEPEPEEAK